MGSALFTIFSLSMDPGFTQTRIAANIVTGIGFLGAGAIVSEHGKVGGLTTAATIWLSAALGMGIGAGDLGFVSVSTGIVLVVLLFFPRIERWIDLIRESRAYKIVIEPGNAKSFEKINQALKTCSLKIIEHHQTKNENIIVGTWRVIGTPKHQNQFVELMLKDKNIKELIY
jgi:putative Mg2+ transporter-C (MgtC) family protein